MNKLSKLTLSLIAVFSANSFAYEVSENIELGMYGDVSYSAYDELDASTFKSNTNIYGTYHFSEKINIHLDGIFQTNSSEIGKLESDYTTGDLYQGYIMLSSRSADIILGRFADFHPMGENALKTSDNLIHGQLSPLVVFGQSTYATIDGARFDYSLPLDDGKITTSFFGGIKTEKYGYDLDIGTELDVESTGYGINIHGQKGYHKFGVGFEMSYMDAVNLADVELTTGDVSFESIHFNYTFENDMMFSQNTYLLNNFEHDGESFDQDILDLKLGVKFMGFKPFIGYNIFENTTEKYETMSFGVKYDYKNKIGVLLKRDQIEQVEGKDQLDDNRLTATVFYNF
jgi:hypothetical protein